MDRHRQHDGHGTGGTECQLHVFGGSRGRVVYLGIELCVLEPAGADQRHARRWMRVQSNDDCRWGANNRSYSDHVDLWAELADAVPIGDELGRPSLGGHHSDARERPSRHFAVFHTCLGGGRNCRDGAKETQQAAPLQNDRGSLFGAWTDGFAVLRRGRGRQRYHAAAGDGDGESGTGDFVCG